MTRFPSECGGKRQAWALAFILAPALLAQGDQAALNKLLTAEAVSVVTVASSPCMIGPSRKEAPFNVGITVSKTLVTVDSEPPKSLKAVEIWAQSDDFKDIGAMILSHDDARSLARGIRSILSRAENGGSLRGAFRLGKFELNVISNASQGVIGSLNFPVRNPNDTRSTFNFALSGKHLSDLAKCIEGSI